MQALPPRVISPRVGVTRGATESPVLRADGPSRRLVLRGLGGALLALPFLESIGPARAGTNATHPLVILRQGNGVAQEDSAVGEAEMFWPSATGVLTRSSLGADKGRATSELADFADRLLMVRGLDYGFPGYNCAHGQSGNQCLTASDYTDDPSGPDSLALGESVDNYVARHSAKNGGEPLTLYTGPRGAYIEEVLSYRGPRDLRAGEDDPWTAYLRLVGGEQLDPLLQTRRLSINDLVKQEMEALLRRDLSAADRARLELHRDSLRDFETMACRFNADEEQAMASMMGLGTLNDNRITVAKMHCDVATLAFACDAVRVVTIQVGDGLDGTEYTVNGTKLPDFHMVSHRQYGHDGTGAAMDGAFQMHHEVDRLVLGVYRHLLEQMDAHGLLDSGLAVYCNDLGTGYQHSYDNVPFIVAGRGDGTFTQGRFIDVGGVTHNKFLNTLITATGLRKSDGSPVDDFGDQSLEKGVLSELMA